MIYNPFKEEENSTVIKWSRCSSAMLQQKEEKKKEQDVKMVVITIVGKWVFDLFCKSYLIFSPKCIFGDFGMAFR